MTTKTTKNPKKSKPQKKAQDADQQVSLDERYNTKGQTLKSPDKPGSVENDIVSDEVEAVAAPKTPEESAVDPYQELDDKYVRLRAEYDNFIKRTAREKFHLSTSGGESVVRAILPIIDDLQRSVDHAQQANEGGQDALLDGVKMVLEKFMQVLETEGVKRIKAAGEKFDPQLHDALMRQPSQDHEEGIVIEEYEPGYTYRNKVIRHAKVVVSG